MTNKEKVGLVGFDKEEIDKEVQYHAQTVTMPERYVWS